MEEFLVLGKIKVGSQCLALRACLWVQCPAQHQVSSPNSSFTSWFAQAEGRHLASLISL